MKEEAVALSSLSPTTVTLICLSLIFPPGCQSAILGDGRLAVDQFYTDSNFLIHRVNSVGHIRNQKIFFYIAYLLL